MWSRIGLLILFHGCVVDAFNILVLYHAQAWGIQLPMFALIEALIKRGHHVTFVGPHKIEGLGENFTFIDLSYNYYDAQEGYADHAAFDAFRRHLTKWDLMNLMPHQCQNIEKLLASDRFKRFKDKVRSKNLSFDSVIIDANTVTHLTVAAEMLAGRKPVIAFSTLPSPWVIQEYLGSFNHLSFSPSFLNPYTDKMTVWQKMENWITDRYFNFRVQSMFRTSAIQHFRPEFGEKTTEVVDASWKRVELLLLASNGLYNYPRLYGPNVIEVGPLHIQDKPQNLSTTVQQFLDGAEKGVLYFNLGSNIHVKDFTDYVIANFLRVFSELPAGYRVLWKWDSDDPIPGQPDYILPQKWVYQQSVLAHPKVKVFITRGGLQSFQEAIHFGVPMIGIPWFGDQVVTVQKMVDAGIGTRLEFLSLTSYQTIKDTIDSFLASENYDVYAKNIKEYSKKTKLLTARSADSAVFWVEHVTRLGGASHLRPSTADVTIFEYFCLDILLVTTIIGVVGYYSGSIAFGRIGLR